MKRFVMMLVSLLTIGGVLLAMQGSPTKAAGTDEYTVALTVWQNNTATVALTGSAEAQVVFTLAAYDADGRMTDVKSVTKQIAFGEKAELSIECGEEVALLKAFVLDASTKKPLRDAWTCADFRAEPQDNASHILVAYFSCTNNTARIAGYVAEALGADLYRITPETPYTSADLNYSSSSTRATREQNDPTARPAISGAAENMAGYDVIYLGYPIWWGQAPKIMYTFVESYDLSGKTIIPFCTSGSSGIGSSASNLSASSADASWLSGRRFSGSDSESAVAAWAKEVLPESTPTVYFTSDSIMRPFLSYPVKTAAFIALLLS